jgi:hypothetical protein
MSSREKAAAAVAALVLAGAGQGAASTLHHAGHGAGPVAGAVAPGQVSTGSNVALGEHMAAGYGWAGGQRDCLNWLWTRESGWNVLATYPSTTTPPSAPSSSITTAYGIPQALPAQKMAAAGPDWRTSAVTQVRWGLGYIKGTYGTPCNAWAHEEADSWY